MTQITSMETEISKDPWGYWQVHLLTPWGTRIKVGRAQTRREIEALAAKAESDN